MNSSLEERLRHIIQHAYQNAPAVRAIMDSAHVSPGDIQSIADLDRVPVTSRDRLIELQRADPPFGGFLAVPRERLKHIYLSPGPLYEVWAGGTEFMIDQMRKSFDVAGFGRGDLVINTLGYHLGPPGFQMDEAIRATGATVILGGVGNQDLQIRMMLELGVTGYCGTPSYLMALIQKAEAMGFDFRQSFALRKAWVGAEPLPPGLRQTLVEKYGLKVTNVYAMSGVGPVAYNTEGGREMHLFDMPIIQVAHLETGRTVAPGETGQVVVTNFHEALPWIRIGTGDLALNLDPAPGQSRQEQRSIILVGRVGEAVKVRGLFVHPNQLRLAISQVPGIARAQGIVTRPETRDELTVRVVLSNGGGEGAAAQAMDREQLMGCLSEAIRSNCRVKVDRMEIVSSEDLAENAKLLVDQRTWG